MSIEKVEIKKPINLSSTLEEIHRNSGNYFGNIEVNPNFSEKNDQFGDIKINSGENDEAVILELEPDAIEDEEKKIEFEEKMVEGSAFSIDFENGKKGFFKIKEIKEYIEGSGSFDQIVCDVVGSNVDGKADKQTFKRQDLYDYFANKGNLSFKSEEEIEKEAMENKSELSAKNENGLEDNKIADLERQINGIKNRISGLSGFYDEDLTQVDDHKKLEELENEKKKLENELSNSKSEECASFISKLKNFGGSVVEFLNQDINAEKAWKGFKEFLADKWFKVRAGLNLFEKGTENSGEKNKSSRFFSKIAKSPFARRVAIGTSLLIGGAVAYKNLGGSEQDEIQKNLNSQPSISSSQVEKQQVQIDGFPDEYKKPGFDFTKITTPEVKYDISIHSVEKNENLWTILEKIYSEKGYSGEELKNKVGNVKKKNNFGDVEMLHAGDTIKVHPNDKVEIVKKQTFGVEQQGNNNGFSSSYIYNGPEKYQQTPNLPNLVANEISSNVSYNNGVAPLRYEQNAYEQGKDIVYTADVNNNSLESILKNIFLNARGILEKGEYADYNKDQSLEERAEGIAHLVAEKAKGSGLDADSLKIGDKVVFNPKTFNVEIRSLNNNVSQQPVEKTENSAQTKDAGKKVEVQPEQERNVFVPEIKKSHPMKARPEGYSQQPTITTEGSVDKDVEKIRERNLEKFNPDMLFGVKTVNREKRTVELENSDFSVIGLSHMFRENVDFFNESGFACNERFRKSPNGILMWSLISANKVLDNFKQSRPDLEVDFRNSPVKVKFVLKIEKDGTPKIVGGTTEF